MSTDKTYNGWTNYETWNVKLWIDNDEGSCTYWQDRADEVLKNNTEVEDSVRTFKSFDTDAASRQLASILSDEIRENAPDLGASCYADLLNAALSEVDWHEIASSMIEDAKERAGD